MGDEEDSSYSTSFFLCPGRAVGGGRDGTLEDELWGTALQAEGQRRTSPHRRVWQRDTSRWALRPDSDFWRSLRHSFKNFILFFFF